MDTEAGKGLSSNDFTDTLKSKLEGIEAGANAYTHPAYTARTGYPRANAAPGFGETVTVSQINSDATGHATAATSRTITIPATLASASGPGLMSAADKSKLDGIGTAVSYRGSVATYTDLPSDAAAGDMYNVTATGRNYIWSGTVWDETGGVIDIESITNAQIDTVVAS